MSGERKLSDLKVNVTSRGLISTWSVDRTSVSDSTKKAMDSYPTKNTFKFKFQPQAKPEFKSVKAHLNNSPQQGLAKVTHLPKKEEPAKDVKVYINASQYLKIGIYDLTDRFSKS